MRAGRWERTGGAFGVLSVIAVFGAVVFESTGPGPSDSAPTVAGKFASDSTGVLIGTYCLIANVSLYGFFLAALRGALRRAEPDTGVLSNLMLGLGLSSLVMTAVYLSIYGSLAHGVASGGGPNLVYALFHVGNAIDELGGVFLGVGAIAGSVVILRTAVFARWIGWLGVVGGSLTALAAFALDRLDSPLGLLGILGLLLLLGWTLSTSVGMLRSKPPVSP